MKKTIAIIISAAMLLCMLPFAAFAAEETNTHKIVLTSTKNEDGSYTQTATIDGEAVTEYDYTWHADPSVEHKDVKNSPAEYYTGTKPGDDSVYIAHDVTYLPELDTASFKMVQYDDKQEYAYYYTAEGYTDFIFCTLPASGNSVDSSMMHTEEEAYQNAVLHITKAGTYEISGEWHGQVKIDLGDDAGTDSSAKVKLILNGVDITCTVAPAVNFYSVYECDNAWEDRETATSTIDTTEAGATVYLADGSVNNVSGANVYRMLKAKAKGDDDQSTFANSVTLQKKLVKTDAAFYSYMTMNIDGDTGVLNITGSYEGLDTELHLSINGGNINIYSQDDGINVNEDGVSVIAFNGGTTHIFAGLGSEGDGVDSNGYLVINGGTVISSANPASDSGLDSDKGSYIYGGTVIALGSTMDWAEDDNSGNCQVSLNLQFSTRESAGEAIIVTDTEGNVVFAYDQDKDTVTGKTAREYQGAVISTSALKEGSTYYIYIGGDVNGTCDANGIYTSAEGFSSDAVQQCTSGTMAGGMGPGGMGDPTGGTTPPTDFDPTQNPGQGGEMPTNPGEGMTPPEGFDPTQNPGQGGQMPTNPDEGMTPPEGFDPTQNPGQGGQMPTNPGDGTTPPEGFDPTQNPGQGGQMPGGNSTYTDQSYDFTMTDTVNGFSSVCDYTSVSGMPALSVNGTTVTLTNVGNDGITLSQAAKLTSVLSGIDGEETALIKTGDTANGRTVVVTGDMDKDGNISVSDARLALRAAVKLDTPADEVAAAGDVIDSDGITITDARQILRYAVKLSDDMSKADTVAE